MSYRDDSDLEFLRKMSDKDLDVLVEIITRDTDGKTRFTESLTGSSAYKQYYPQHSKYIDEICEELQRFAGNTISNIVGRFGKGVLYKEALCDVCDKIKVAYNKNDDTKTIERNMLLGIVKKEIADMDNKKAEEFYNILRESGKYSSDMFSMGYSKDLLIGIAQQILFKGGIGSFFMTNIISSTVTNAILGRVVTLAGSSALGKTLTAWAGPIGLGITGVWTASDLASTAYRVTIPAVVQVAFLRSKYENEEEIRKEMEEMERENERLKEQVNSIVKDSKLSEKDAVKLIKNVWALRKQKTNLLIVGPSGVGKSDTINALFDIKTAKSSDSLEPQTMEIEKYEKHNLILWDSPGLGDGVKDSEHRKKIISKLQEEDKDGNALIDCVLVILDGSSRDLGTAYNLITETILPNLKEKERILIALNKCDKAISELEYDLKNNKPSDEQIAWLEEGVDIIRKRIREATEVDVDVIYYSASTNEKYKKQPYNISKLYKHILDHTPSKKRFVYNKSRSENQANYQYSDEKTDYNKASAKSWWDSIVEFVSDGIEAGKEIVVETITKNKEKIVEVLEDGASWAIDKIGGLFGKIFKK